MRQGSFDVGASQWWDGRVDMLIWIPAGIIMLGFWGLFALLLSPVIVPAWVWAKLTGRPRDESFWARVATVSIAVLCLLVSLNGAVDWALLGRLLTLYGGGS
jgi:hypothetical protein